MTLKVHHRMQDGSCQKAVAPVHGVHLGPRFLLDGADFPRDGVDVVAPFPDDQRVQRFEGVVPVEDDIGVLRRNAHAGGRHQQHEERHGQGSEQNVAVPIKEGIEPSGAQHKRNGEEGAHLEHLRPDGGKFGVGGHREVHFHANVGQYTVEVAAQKDALQPLLGPFARVVPIGHGFLVGHGGRRRDPGRRF